ncbi:MAG: nucleotidyltransferase domain-containing protein [Motilibacteraceae bacterium]
MSLSREETRPHQDLDPFIDTVAVPRLLSWLQSRGYEATEDWRAVHVQLVSTAGRVAVHPRTIQANGDGIQQGFGDEAFVHPAAERAVGVVGGRDVVVATPARLRELRTGYEPRPLDNLGLGVLDGL